jgi:hypothetical protein
LSDPYCLIAFTKAIDQEGLIMKCAICEIEFCGVGYKTHNDKILCRNCTKDVVLKFHKEFVMIYLKPQVKV